MSISSLKEAKDLLESSMRHKGFYDVSSVNALVACAEHLEFRLNQIEAQRTAANDWESAPDTMDNSLADKTIPSEDFAFPQSWTTDSDSSEYPH